MSIIRPVKICKAYYNGEGTIDFIMSHMFKQRYVKERIDILSTLTELISAEINRLQAKLDSRIKEGTSEVR